MVKDRDDRVIGKIFSMVSPAEEGNTSGGIPYGSSSGKQYRDQAVPIRVLHPIPYEAFLQQNIEAKYHIALVFALRSDLRVINSVNPSTLVMIESILTQRGEALLADIENCSLNNAPGVSEEARDSLQRRLRPVPERLRRLREILRSEGRLIPRAVWPNICAINTWQGGSAPFYLGKVRSGWGEAPQRCLGLRATEGMFSIPLQDSTASAVLAINGHFMEFVEDEEDIRPDSPTLLAHELETGRRYRLIITTSSGLYRYDLGDIVEVTGWNRNTPEIAFLHKAGGVLSITGEKVYEDQVVAVMAVIAADSDVEIRGFTLTLELSSRVGYGLLIETLGDPGVVQLQRIIDLFDSELSRMNIEYRDKRKSGRLSAPVLFLVREGAYQGYREMQVSQGRPDGQIKPLHILKPYGEGMIEDSPENFIRDFAGLKRQMMADIHIND